MTQVPAGFCATSYATGIKTARGLFYHETLTNGDLLVLARGDAAVYSVWGSNPDQRAKIAGFDGLNHGLTVGPKPGGGAYLFASSSGSVYRWNYTPGARTDLGGATVGQC